MPRGGCASAGMGGARGWPGLPAAGGRPLGLAPWLGFAGAGMPHRVASGA